MRVEEVIVEMYCDNCDRHSKHRYMGNFKDGGLILGRYICKDCGTETEGTPMIEWKPNLSNK